MRNPTISVSGHLLHISRKLGLSPRKRNNLVNILPLLISIIAFWTPCIDHWTVAAEHYEAIAVSLLSDLKLVVLEGLASVAQGLASFAHGFVREANSSTEFMNFNLPPRDTNSFPGWCRLFSTGLRFQKEDGILNLLRTMCDYCHGLVRRREGANKELHLRPARGGRRCLAHPQAWMCMLLWKDLLSLVANVVSIHNLLSASHFVKFLSIYAPK